MNVTTIITINNNNNIQLLPRNNPYIEEKKLKNYFIPSAFKHNIPCNNSKFESNLLQIYPRRRGGLYYIITANDRRTKVYNAMLHAVSFYSRNDTYCHC